MSLAKLGMYTTADSYRNVGSNHITNFSYDEAGMVLYVQFYNKSRYKYYGVARGLYEGLKASTGSHGTYFWRNIRGTFPCELMQDDILANTREQSPRKDSVIYKLNPELLKLDTLDEQEKQLNKEFKAQSISSEEYYNSLSSMEVKRDKLILTLEKKGYFAIDEEDIEEEELAEYSQEKASSNSINIGEGIIATLRVVNDIALFTLKVALSLITVFFGLAAVFMKK